MGSATKSRAPFVAVVGETRQPPSVMPEMTTGQGRAGSDARGWDEEGYKKSILRERELRCRTVFRTAFSPSSNPNPETLVVASSDGSLASYSLASCNASTYQHPQVDMVTEQRTAADPLLAEPHSIIQAHKGPIYDLKFYRHGDGCLLFSCGDDGRLRAWNWEELLSSHIVADCQGNSLKPILNLANPQRVLGVLDLQFLRIMPSQSTNRFD